MKTLYSRIPAAAVFSMFDGNMYANIPHVLKPGGVVSENFDSPRMMRFDSASFVRNGEAYVYFGKVGDAIALSNLPFGVTVLLGIV